MISANHQTPLRVAFLVDAGGGVGWGHYVRCQALAAELERHGADVAFHVNGAVPSLPGGHAARRAGGPGDTKILGSLCAQSDIVVVDLYDYSAIRHMPIGPSVVSVCITDGRDPEDRFEILVDPNLCGLSSAQCARHGIVLRGREHVILREQFDRAESRICSEMTRSLLVSFGGTPQPDLTEMVYQACRSDDRLSFGSVTVVGGEECRKRPWTGSGKRQAEWHLVSGVRDMCQLMYAADVGVIAAGTMLYEACATGLPSLVVALNRSQALEAEALATAGAVHYLGLASDITPEKFADALARLRCRECRQVMSRRAQSVIDGGGRRRIVEAILESVRRVPRGYHRWS